MAVHGTVVERRSFGRRTCARPVADG